MTTEQYLTEEGRLGAGDTTNRLPTDALKHQHDILKRATEEGLDVFLLCGTLDKHLREELYRTVSPVSFASQLRGLLQAGCNIRIFIWNKIKEGLISPEIQSLLQDIRHRPFRYKGTMGIRISGTCESAEKVSHFLVATNRQRSRWLVRLEDPQAEHVLDSAPNWKKVKVPAIISYNGNDARTFGPELMKTFECLYEAAGSPRENSTPVVEAEEASYPTKS